MKEPYSEGVAIHTGPESCIVTRNGESEALTEGRIGWVWSHEIRFIAGKRCSGTPTPSGWRKAILGTSMMREAFRPAWSETPGMCGNTLSGSREIPSLSVELADCIGKSKDTPMINGAGSRTASQCALGSAWIRMVSVPLTLG